MARLYLYAAIVAVALAAVAAYTWNQREIGREQERAATERRNLDARNSADDFDGSYMQCVRSGGLYQFDTGKCRWPAPGDGD